MGQVLNSGIRHHCHFTGKKVMPISAAYVGTGALKTIKMNDDEVNYYSSRLFFTHQLILGRKFSEGFSMQIMPTLVHRNLVETREEKNDVYALGIAARKKLTRRISINAEYYYVVQNQLLPDYRNSLSIGFDIETGGHVFQLHFTNSTSMIEKGFYHRNGRRLAEWRYSFWVQCIEGIYDCEE
jgi:hypothetical protein